MEIEKRQIQKRPELVPERLMRGGLIVGVEQGIQGSLMSVTGAAIERITRERTEVPPQFKLPERPVYFLDPNTRRLIMISNRENRGENKTPDKYGLFAEIVELDEEGKPHYRLSTSEIILPNDNYQLVAVGPNNYGLPPSHIEVVEEEEEGKKKFVPWNLWLGNLQNWMNELRVDTNEGFDAFVERFYKSRLNSETNVKRKIEETFRESYQGIDEKTIPANIIITDKGENDLLYEVSREAGFYPVIFTAGNLAALFDEIAQRHESIIKEDLYNIGHYARHDVIKYSIGVLTIDEDALDQEDSSRVSKLSLRYIPGEFQKFNSIFALVSVRRQEIFNDPDSEPKKRNHGYYFSPYDEDQYRGLLNKLKADLLLTMFLRGGAPIVK